MLLFTTQGKYDLNSSHRPQYSHPSVPSPVLSDGWLGRSGRYPPTTHHSILSRTTSSKTTVPFTSHLQQLHGIKSVKGKTKARTRMSIAFERKKTLYKPFFFFLFCLLSLCSSAETSNTKSCFYAVQCCCVHAVHVISSFTGTKHSCGCYCARKCARVCVCVCLNVLLFAALVVV